MDQQILMIYNLIWWFTHMQITSVQLRDPIKLKCNKNLNRLIHVLEYSQTHLSLEHNFET